MNNKKKGTGFENELANILAKNGFWARLDKGYSQTCDIIAGKNGIIFLFECKTCKKDYFNLDRIEENQKLSRERFKMCGNEEAWIVYKLDDGRIFFSRVPLKTPSNGISLDLFRALKD